MGFNTLGVIRLGVISLGIFTLGGFSLGVVPPLKSYFKEYNYLIPKVAVSVFSNLFKSFIYKVPEI